MDQSYDAIDIRDVPATRPDSGAPMTQCSQGTGDLLVMVKG